MKRLILIISLLLAVAIYGQKRGPQITIPEESFDFGDVQEGVKVNHSFVIKNTGDENLVINKVKASCGCTAAFPEKNELAPGDSTNIEVTFNTSRRSGMQKKYVYVFSNDPDQEDVRLSFTANVIKEEKENQSGPMLKLARNKVNFGEVNEGSVVDADIRFENTGKKALRIKDIKTSCGCTAALLSDRDLEPGETGNLRIELDTSDRRGRMTRTVTLYSNDPVNPVQPITLYVNVQNKG